ncbi:MAG: orotate phosphoribosyltransferase [Chloroflexota bacterium]
MQDAHPDAHQLARALARSGAVQRSPDLAGTVRLDISMLYSHPEQASIVREHLLAWLERRQDAFDLIVSPNIASLPLATMAASALSLPMAYLRPRPKAHGRRRQVEGVLPEGGRVLLLYAEILPETPIQEAREIVEANGGTVANVLGLLRDDRVAVTSLTTHTDVLQALDAEAGRLVPTPTAPRALPLPSADRLERTRERVAEILLGVGAVMVNAQQPFRYTSGVLSPIYTDNRLLISHPAEWGEIIEGYADALATVAGRQPVDALAGAVTAGLPHGARLAEETGYPLTFVDLGDTEGATDGLSGRAYGRLRAGERVVMVEDLVTTGKSVFESAAALRERGALVDWCLAIFTYNPEKIGAVLAAEGLGFTVLSDITTLLEVGVRSGQLSEADRAAVLEWLDDPQGWSQRAEERLAAAGA